MTEQEIAQDRVARAVYDLMTSAATLAEVALDRTLAPFLRLEYDDISVAHCYLGRLLIELHSKKDAA